MESSFSAGLQREHDAERPPAEIPTTESPRGVETTPGRTLVAGLKRTKIKH